MANTNCPSSHYPTTTDFLGARYRLQLMVLSSTRRASFRHNQADFAETNGVQKDTFWCPFAPVFERALNLMKDDSRGELLCGGSGFGRYSAAALRRRTVGI